MVTSKSLNLYRYSTSSFKVKTVKNFSIVVIDYSFEPVEGVLAIISPNGKICLFNLYQPKGSKLYQSFVFTIKLETSLARSVSTGAKGNNLVKFVNRLDLNQLQLYKIYEFLYLVHVDNLQGFLYFYKVTSDKPPGIFAVYKISQGIYGLGFSENLIILQSYNSQETLIYDIESQLQEFLIIVNHSEIIVPSNRRFSAEYSVKIDLNSDFFFVADEVMVDLKTFSFKTFNINPATLIENHPDDVKIILFLLRRDNCKMKVLEKIKESLLTKTPLKKLEIIFATLASAYNIAKNDKQTTGRQKLSENSEHLELSTNEIDPTIEVKIESGLTVLMQSEIYSCVFSQVYKQIDDQRYFAEALLSFCNCLIQAKVQVHFSIQYLLFKVFLKIQDFSRIQKLVENKFFTDSQDIALFLTSLGKGETIKKFPNCFVLGIDMLLRLKLFDVMSRELAEQGYGYESLFLCRNNNLSEAVVRNIIGNYEYE